LPHIGETYHASTAMDDLQPISRWKTRALEERE
jgi:hypothetical protein